MNSTNYQQVSAVKNFLPDYILTRDNPTPRIPVMSKQSAEIFSKIRQSIPDSTESFSSVKKLNVSASEITTTVKQIAALKKNETPYKVGSVLGTVAIVVILAVLIAQTVAAAILFSPIVLAIGACGVGIGVAGLVIGSLAIHVTFTSVPDANKKLSTQVQETKDNHEKLKAYFTDNYKALKNEIVTSIERKNQDLELMVDSQEDHSAKKKQLNDEVATLEQAHVELKNLHRFYNTPEITE